MADNIFLGQAEKFPQMIEEALSFGRDLKKIKKPGAVFIAGMGGSAISGDVAASYLRDQSTIPITVIRDYLLPASAKKGDLVICISYSGNTEETLDIFYAAKAKGIGLACITSGGKIKEEAEKNKLPLVLVPSGIQPRAALPYLFTVLLKVLEKAEVAPSQEKSFARAVYFLSGKKKEIDGKAQDAAKFLKGKIPIIFASAGITGAVGYRFKTQFNENSKVTCLLSIFPELDHNEIVNLSYLKKGSHNFALLILRDKEDHPRTKKRIEITKSLIAPNIGETREISSSGEDRLSRMLYLIFLGDLLTTYLAILEQRDPADVLIIEKLKKELKR